MTFKELAVGQRFTIKDTGWTYEKILSRENDRCNFRFLKTFGPDGIGLEGACGCENEDFEVILLDPLPQTLRTDAEYGNYLHGMIPVELAKQLEQELSEALAREQKLRDDLEDIRTILGR